MSYICVYVQNISHSFLFWSRLFFHWCLNIPNRVSIILHSLLSRYPQHVVGFWMILASVASLVGSSVPGGCPDEGHNGHVQC